MERNAISLNTKLEGAVRESLVVPELDFLQRLLVECRRAERSKRKFVLVLIRGMEKHPSETLAIVSILRSLMRETDTLGWYEQGTILGVLCSELCGCDAEIASRTIHDKIARTLPASEYRGLTILPHVLPRDLNRQTDSEEMPARLSEYLAPLSSSRMRGMMLLKRVIDIVCSSLLLLIFGIPMLIIAALIRLDSKGPALFRQTRIGQHGKPFTCLKFRSMSVACNSAVHEKYVTDFIRGQADKNPSGSGKAIFKLTQDSRVTRVGKYLRKTSLDELPQFLNVLAGQMSLVGPRPPISYEVAKYELWHQRRILELKPGLTGLWQVNGRSRTGFDDMVRLDLQYARTWSPWLDIKIILSTPMAMIAGTGAC